MKIPAFINNVPHESPENKQMPHDIFVKKTKPHDRRNRRKVRRHSIELVNKTKVPAQSSQANKKSIQPTQATEIAVLGLW
jgi:hypothetical protein